MIYLYVPFIEFSKHKMMNHLGIPRLSHIYGNDALTETYNNDIFIVIQQFIKYLTTEC